jgi:AhpD family alkylhydroperoxidase
MRIAPIEKPDSLKLKLLYRTIRRRMGKVITPAKVVYARVPASVRLMYEMATLPDKGMTVSPELRFLVQHYVAAINKCAFCMDIGKALAMQHRVDLEKFNHLHEFRTNSMFSDRERAALEYVEEATTRKVVSDATFDRLRKHFNDREIVELTLLNAIENFYNLVNIPLEIESDGLCLFPARDRRGKLVAGAN